MSQNTENAAIVATATATAPAVGTEAQPLATGAENTLATEATQIVIRPPDTVRKLIQVDSDGKLSLLESDTPVNLDELCGVLTEDATQFNDLGLSLAAMLRLSRKLPYVGDGSAYDFAAEKVKAKAGSSFGYVQGLVASLDVIEVNGFKVGPTVFNDCKHYFKKRELLLSNGKVKPEGESDAVVMALKAGTTQAEMREIRKTAQASFPALFPPAKTKAPSVPTLAAPATEAKAPAEKTGEKTGVGSTSASESPTPTEPTAPAVAPTVPVVNESQPEAKAPESPAPVASDSTPPTDGKPIIPKDSPESISLDMHTLCGRIERVQASHGIKAARAVWAAHALELARMAGLVGCKLAK